jgi:hypothetical protein
VVLAGYRAKLNYLLLSVLDGIERNVPAFRVGVRHVQLLYDKILLHVHEGTFNKWENFF